MAIWNGGIGCLGGYADSVELKEKLITWVVGVDVSAWSSLCGVD